MSEVQHFMTVISGTDYSWLWCYPGSELTHATMDSLLEILISLVQVTRCAVLSSSAHTVAT